MLKLRPFGERLGLLRRRRAMTSVAVAKADIFLYGALLEAKAF